MSDTLAQEGALAEGAEDLRIEQLGPASLRITGEVDLANADELEAALERIHEAGEDVVLDLEGLTFIDSTGLRQLILLARRLPEGRSLVLRSVTVSVRRTLEIAGLPEIPQVRLPDPEGGQGQRQS